MGISRREDFVSGKCYQAPQDGVRYTDTMREALPKASEETCVLAADLITITLSSVGKRFSETPGRRRRSKFTRAP